MNSWTAVIAVRLADYYIAATLLLLIVLALMLALRQPSRRLPIGWATILGLAALPLLLAVPGRPRVSWPAALANPMAAPASTGDLRPTAPAAVEQVGVEAALLNSGNTRSGQPLIESGPDASQPHAAPPGLSEPARRWGPEQWACLAVALFAGGAALVGAWLGCGAVQTVLLCRRARPAPQRLRAELSAIAGAQGPAPRLLVSSEIGNPAAVGVLRPAIVLPSRFVEEMPPGGLRAALAHEWAHVSNGDLRLLALSRVLLLVLYAHPVYWWLRRRIRDDQEALADAAVAGRVNRADYAEQLLDWARSCPRRPAIQAAAALGIWERPSRLSRRISILLDERRRLELKCPRRWRYGWLAILGLLAAGTSVLTLSPLPQAKAEPATASAVSPSMGPSASGAPQASTKADAKDSPNAVAALEVSQGIPVAVVKPRRHESPHLDDSFYVEQALAPGNSGGWAIRTTSLTPEGLLTERLSSYTVVYCVNLPALDAGAAERLRSYVEGGGNVVWTCGDNVQPEAYNRMNDDAQRQLLPAPLLEVRQPQPGEDRDSWHVSFLDEEHRALAHLVEPASLYQSVLVYKHARIDAGAAGDARVLARLDDGEALLVERNVERGTVTMLGTSAHVDWTNLPVRPLFLPLVVRLTFELAGAEQARYQALAGTPIIVPFDEETRPLGVEILPPSGATIRRKLEDEGGRRSQSFRFADTHDVGIYTLRMLEAVRPTQYAYSVNVDPDEADPTKISREELEERFGATPLVFAEDPEDLSSTFAWLREGTSLWELFLAAVLIALVFETFISNQLTPKQEEDELKHVAPGMRRLARKGRSAA